MPLHDPLASMSRSVIAAVATWLTIAAAAHAGEAATQGRIVNDLPYKSGDGLSAYEQERCRLDIYLPPGSAAATNAPVLIFFHGGAITAGDKDSAKTIAALVNAHGIVAVGVNHRLSPKVHYPDYIRDCAAAIAWVKNNIAQYGGSPLKLFVSGHSAGGYLTMMAALGPGYLEAVGLKLSDIAGLIPISGQMVTHSTVREERGIPRSVIVVDEAAPLQHVRKIPTPVLSICGGQDMPARLEENLLMDAWLKAAGNTDVSILCVSNRTHTSVYDRCAEPGDKAGQAIGAFILKHSSAP